MEKYEKMIMKKREKDDATEKRVLTIIKQILEDDEQVTVNFLVKKTGLSRSYFYNNPTIHEEMVRAQELQAGKTFNRNKKVVFDKAMEQEINQLKKALHEKDAEIAKLKLENAKLSKMADVKILSVLKEI